MENLNEKVEKQTKDINDGIIHYKAAIMTLKMNSSLYYRKELKQKIGILESFIEVLESLKIK